MQQGGRGGADSVEGIVDNGLTADADVEGLTNFRVASDVVADRFAVFSFSGRGAGEVEAARVDGAEGLQAHAIDLLEGILGVNHDHVVLAAHGICKGRLGVDEDEGDALKGRLRAIVILIGLNNHLL